MTDGLSRYLNPNTSGPKVSTEISGIRRLGEELISVTEAAKEISVSPQAIRKAISDKRLIARMVGKQHVIERTDFDAFKERYSHDRR